MDGGILGITPWRMSILRSSTRACSLVKVRLQVKKVQVKKVLADLVVDYNNSRIMDFQVSCPTNAQDPS